MKKVFLVVFLFLLFAQIGLAQTLEFKEVSTLIDLQESRETINISVSAKTNLSRIFLTVPKRPTDIETDLDYEIREVNNKFRIDIIKNLSTGEEFDFALSFKTSGLVEKIGDEFLFTFTFNQETEKFTLKVILPEKSSIVDENGLLVTKPVDITTDGKRIFLTWERKIERGEEFVAFARYRSGVRGSNSILIIIVLVVIGSAFVIGYKSMKLKKEKLIKEVLSEDERKVADYIMKRKEVLQEDLKKDLDWSKTKVSKIVRNLEKKNIIIKTPYRKTNKLKIK